MPDIGDEARTALEPWVGRIVAAASVRAAATSLGITPEELAPEHLPQLEESIRHVLAPVAPPAAIDDVIAHLRAQEMGR
jgi:hypothetical protein